MISTFLLRLVGGASIGAVLVLAASLPAGAQSNKPWRHGIIAPKADAGFLLMAARRGFAASEGLKLELLEVKDDAVKTGAIAPDLPLPMDKLGWMQDQLVALRQIPKAGDLVKMVDPDIRAEALERAGR